MEQSQNRISIEKLCGTAMMTAIVFVGNYLRVKFAIPIGGTVALTAANIFCALAGLLLGPWWGGLAAGLGSALYDVMDPSYVAEAPITFCTKGMYGLVAGLVLYYVFKNARDKYGPQQVAAICAAVSYMVVYNVKVFFYNGMVLQGFTEPAQCWALIVAKLPGTLFNGIVAMVFAPILGVALRRAMRRAHLDRFLAAS